MSFEIEGGVVRWKDRVVKGADAGTFETLRGPVGADASTVWFGAKAQKVDRTTFEVLGTHYAKDANAVFYAIETKLKPVKGADASSFEALGSYYGRDAASGYFKERRLKLVKSATGSLDGLREIGAPFATDGGALYHAHQRIRVSNEGYGDAPRELPKIELGSARLRAFGYNEVNCPALLLDDGRATLWRADSWRWFDVSGVDFEDARELGPDDVWRRRFLWDGSVLFAGGARVEVPEGIEPILVGEDVVEVGDRVLRGAERLEGFRPGELRWLGGQRYQTSGETVTLTPDGDLARTERPPVPALADALRALVLPASELFASIADRYLPIEATPSDFDYDVPPPGGAVELEVSSATSAIARFRVGDEAFEAPPGALLTQLTSAWALSRGRADRLLVFAGYVWMGPHAHSIQAELARRFPEAWGDLVAALFASGAKDCAALHVQRGVAALERDEEGLAALLARIPFEMAASVRYVPHHHAIDVTTNFAVVKLMAEPDGFAHEDVRVRVERALYIAQATLDCNKKDRAVPLAVDALIRALDRPMAGGEREAFLCALDMTCVAATVASDMGEAYAYDALVKGATVLLEAGVQPLVQRVRLVEALFGRGEDEAVEREATALAESAADDAPLSGPYVNRARWMGPRAAALAARARALPARARRGLDVAAAREGLRAELEALRVAVADDDRTEFMLNAIGYDIDRV